MGRNVTGSTIVDKYDGVLGDISLTWVSGTANIHVSVVSTFG